jgi:hypothetical protein
VTTPSGRKTPDPRITVVGEGIRGLYEDVLTGPRSASRVPVVKLSASSIGYWYWSDTR